MDAIPSFLAIPDDADRAAPMPRDDGGTRQSGDGPAPIKVLYIAGYGRSGTTLLDIALGEHPAIMGAGEVTALTRHVWANDEFCACGATIRECSLWRAIMADWSADETPGFLDDYRRAQEGAETILGDLRHRAGRGTRDHRARTHRLLRAIAARSGRAVVLDSSKLPGRGLALLRVPDVELFVVHVVRDARAVAWSMAKAHARQVEKGIQRALRPKAPLRTALRWAIVNLAAERLCARVGAGRSVRVRYEDFVADPAQTLARILQLVGHRPAPGPTATFAPQHQMAGSRHRMQPTIAIEPDERWKEAMPARQQWLVTALTAPLLRRYRYPLGAADRRGAAR